MTSSRLLPPRFFQLDSSTLQTGLEARLRDLVHASVSPLVAGTYMEEFRAFVELAVSLSCLLLGLLASRSEQLTGCCVAYGDHIYNLRYVTDSPVAAKVAFSRFAPPPTRHTGLLARLLLRFVMLQVVPVFSRLVQRRIAEQHQEQQQQQQNNPDRNDHPATADRSPGQVVLIVARNTERVVRVLDLLNHIVFLFDGSYRNVIDRILGVRLASGDRELQLSAHTYLIDRQHYWATLFAAMSLFVPMLNISGWAAFFARQLRRLIFRVSSSSFGAAPPAASGSNNSQHHQQQQQQLQQLRQQQMNFECLICHTEPMAMPQRAKECQHLSVCYFCAATQKPEACPLCHEPVSCWKCP